MISESLTLVHNFLEESARRYSDKCAIIHENNRVLYSELNSKSNHLAIWLIRQGIKKGDKVALIFENSVEYVTAYYGILKSGAVVVSLDTQTKPDRLKSIITQLDIQIIITSSKQEQTLSEADFQQLNLKAFLIHEPKFQWIDKSVELYRWSEVVPNTICNNPEVAVDLSDLAAIVYTSGSTGSPKGVMLTHSNIVANTKSICEYLKLTNKDIHMVVLPFFYVMGKSSINTHVAVGGTIVINNRFAFPAAIMKQMIDEKITGFSGVPSTFAYLLNCSPLEKSRDLLTSLRFCAQAGGHLSKQIKQRLREALPAHTDIYIMYGATEASARLTYLEPLRFFDKMDSIGKAIPGVEIKILDKNGNRVETCQVGEIVASGKNIMKGYFEDHEATSKVLDEHGYHTGDLGYFDNEGFIYLVGRADNLVKVGGHRVNPSEAEEVIMESGLVMETIVLTISDSLLGNKLVALVTTIDPSTSARQIVEYCVPRLPKHKLPGDIRLVKSLPKLSSGKIDKKKCEELIVAQ